MVTTLVMLILMVTAMAKMMQAEIDAEFERLQDEGVEAMSALWRASKTVRAKKNEAIKSQGAFAASAMAMYKGTDGEEREDEGVVREVFTFSLLRIFRGFWMKRFVREAAVWTMFFLIFLTEVLSRMWLLGCVFLGVNGS